MTDVGARLLASTLLVAAALAAWSHYRVEGEFRGPDGAVGLSMLESAVLERAAEGWRLALVNTMARADPRP